MSSRMCTIPAIVVRNGLTRLQSRRNCYNAAKACLSAGIKTCLEKKKLVGIALEHKASLYPPPENALSSGQARPRDVQHCKINGGYFVVPLTAVPILV